jgi:azurin
MKFVLALLFVLGTGSLTTAANPPRTIDISASDDMKYSVNVIRAKAGEPLRLRLVSKGTLPKIAMAHNVVVLKLGTDAAKFIAAGASDRATDFIAPSTSAAVIAKTPFAGPGETVQVVFTAPSKPGRYPFVCTFAGHFQAGMQGTLIVN